MVYIKTEDENFKPKKKVKIWFIRLYVMKQRNIIGL